MIIAVWIKDAVSWVESPLAAVTIMMCAMLATNIAKTCCRPKGMDFKIGTRPLRE